jgi:hypothetical protein
MTETEKIQEVLPTVNRFAKWFGRYSNDPSEFISTANLAALKAVRSFQPGNRKLVPWTLHLVKVHLLRSIKKEKTVLNKKMKQMEEEPAAPIRATDKLTEDAEYVARLALNLPDEIEVIAKHYPPQHRGIKIRELLKQYLRKQGWQLDRISEAYREIATALSTSR